MLKRTKNRILLLLFCVLGASFAHALECSADAEDQILERQKNKNYPKEMQSQWFEADEPQSFALVIHGLNAKPQIMQPLIEFLKSKNISSYRVTLSGHANSMEEFHQVTESAWNKEVKQSYCVVWNRAQKNKEKIHFVGYSIGTLLFSNFVAEHPKARPERMIMFAPPYRLTKFASAIDKFFWMDRFVVPSMANIGGYRAQWGVPISAYKAFFKAYEKFSRRDKAPIKAIPTVVFLDKEDELVSFREVQSWVTSGGGKSWKFHEVSNSESQLFVTHDHLITDEKFLGKKEWKRVKSLISSHLKVN